MKIRDLTAADLFKLAEIADKITADLIEKMTDEINEKKLGIQIALAVLRYIPTEIKEFLALVTDQTPEDLDKKSFTEPVKILRALWQKEDFKDFLQELNYLREEISKKRST